MSRPLNFKLYLSIIYIGFGSILSQILLVREFLVSFYGNELSIGIVLACWLFWIGTGSAFGNNITKLRRNVSPLFYILLVAAPSITFVQVLIVKFAHAFIQIAPGEFLSLTELFVFAFIALCPGCFLWGTLFTLGADNLGVENKKLWLGVNKAYVLELIGSIIGGLLFSFFLASVLSTFQIIIFLVLMACFIVMWSIYPRRTNSIVIFFLAAVTLHVFLISSIDSVEQKLNALQWSYINDKLTFIRSIDTKYQNLSLLRLQNQYTIYSDGRPSYNIPNTYDAEVFVHSIMIHRPDASRVLVIGGGFGGIIKEILKYPVNEIEYIEIDPELLSFINPVLDKHNLLNDSRVKIISGDGREHLRWTNHNYDVIMLNVGEPLTASMNRFYTYEFYQQCASRLTQDDIFALPFPSSTEYIANELKDLNTSLYYTFKQAFTNILVIPGNHAVMIGSNSKHPFTCEADSLARLFQASRISCNFFSEYMYKDLMPPERLQFIIKTLETAQNYRLNTDNDPVTYYFDLLLWNRFLHGDNQFFSSITSAKIFITVSIGIAILLTILTLYRNRPVVQKRISLAVIIACGGFVCMALNLLLLLNFQETFGSIYEMVGAVIAANMLGMALGASGITSFLKRYKSKSLLLTVLIGLVVFILLMPLILKLLLTAHIVWFTLLIVTFSGAFIGVLYGTVNRLYLENSKSAGSIYSFDVIGSSIGALTTCSILLPILGIYQMTYLLVLIILPAIAAVIKRVF